MSKKKFSITEAFWFDEVLSFIKSHKDAHLALCSRDVAEKALKIFPKESFNFKELDWEGLFDFVFAAKRIPGVEESMKIKNNPNTWAIGVIAETILYMFAELIDEKAVRGYFMARGRRAEDISVNCFLDSLRAEMGMRKGLVELEKFSQDQSVKKKVHLDDSL